MVISSKDVGEALEYLAQLFSSRQDYGTALHLWAAACREDARNSLRHYHAGKLLVSLGRYKEAVPYLQVAADLEPHHMATRYSLAKALACSGEWKPALDAILAADFTVPRTRPLRSLHAILLVLCDLRSEVREQFESLEAPWSRKERLAYGLLGAPEIHAEGVQMDRSKEEARLVTLWETDKRGGPTIDLVCKLLLGCAAGSNKQRAKKPEL